METVVGCLHLICSAAKAKGVSFKSTFTTRRLLSAAAEAAGVNFLQRASKLTCPSDKCASIRQEAKV